MSTTYPLYQKYKNYDIIMLGSIEGVTGDEIRRIKKANILNSPYLVEKFVQFFKIRFRVEDFDYITYVPSNKNHHLLSVLAQTISDRLEIPCYPFIQFTKEIPEQKKIEHYEDRYINVKDAFSFKNVPDAADRILLIDDVFASGATLKQVLDMFCDKQCSHVLSIIFAYRNMQK